MLGITVRDSAVNAAEPPDSWGPGVHFIFVLLTLATSSLLSGC
jgi:hypothetical protein